MKKIILIFSAIALLSCKDEKPNSTKSSDEKTESVSTDTTQKATLNK